MGAIVNGMAAHGGTLPYGATFLIFSDYMRPSIRLAALMGLHVIHVFTHDSIALGEDGPTHQPVEQLAGLRAIPNLTLIRPGRCQRNRGRVAGGARNSRSAGAAGTEPPVSADARPATLCIRRRPAPRRVRVAGRGQGKPDLILIASGSEVALIVSASERLRSEGIAVRCVSMPSWELFEALPRADRDRGAAPDVWPRDLRSKRASPQGWCRYVGDRGDVLSVDRFGASAPGKEVLDQYGFTVDNVCNRARTLLGQMS